MKRLTKIKNREVWELLARLFEHLTFKWDYPGCGFAVWKRDECVRIVREILKRTNSENIGYADFVSIIKWINK
jgi:hypothetical protein